MNISRTAILAHRVLTGPDLKEQLNRCVLVDNGKILDILPAEEYRKLKDMEHKMVYIVAYLAEKYEICERKVYKIIKSMERDCMIDAVG